ncbi:MAG: response regulator [Draconibacterium sp.]|nr:response regulator [Draconibacterium sp.]
MLFNWKDKTIVVVDDTEINFVLIKTQLRKTNANIIWLKNGQEAIEFVQNKRVVDLILMDIRMPVLDGIQATQKIKQVAPEISVVIQTASVMGNVYNDISSSGCDDVIFKPIVSSKLIDIISKQFLKKSKI